MKSGKKLLGAAAVVAIIAAAGFVFANSEDLQGRFGRRNGIKISTTATPVNATVIAGTTSVQFSGFTLECASKLDCTVTDLTIQGYLDDDGDGSYLSSDSSTTAHGSGLSDYVSNVYIVDSTGTVVDGPESISTTFKTYFNSISYTIPSKSSVSFYIVGDLSVKAFEDGDAENIAFGILSSSDVVTEDSDGNALTGIGRANTPPTVYMTTSL